MKIKLNFTKLKYVLKLDEYDVIFEKIYVNNLVIVSDVGKVNTGA